MNVLFQNGVVSGPTRSSQIGMGSCLDSHNGNVALNDTSKRPNLLVVNPTKEYMGKPIRKDSTDTDDDGSLPYTPDMSPDSELNVSGCLAGDELLEKDTRQLISRVLMELSGHGRARWTESRTLSTMKRVVAELLEKHRYVYNGMTKRLSLADTQDNVSFVSTVSRDLFSDGATNWGRIASLVAFGVVVSQCLKENGKSDRVELVAHEISTYLLTDQRDWMCVGGDGFVEFFRVADPESTVRNALMTIAGVAGIGATLALLIR
uniref:Bcl-2 Bcl-2 homology region 1-3 domain-containing protein n=1 Tax=Mola mola TaxID=94237 RepID=A0A3Q3VP02_MOLML